MAIKPKNKFAERLLDKLAVIGHHPMPGYHGTANYCVAVHVNDCGEAVRLGMYLGDSVGEVTFDKLPSERGQRVVFSDALVSQ